MSCSGCKETPPYTHTLSVEKPRATTEPNGQVNLSKDSNWVHAWLIRARFLTPNRPTFTSAAGSEDQVGNQQIAIQPVVIMARYSSPSRMPLPSYRLRLGTRVFNITRAFRVNESEDEIHIEAIELREPL